MQNIHKQTFVNIEAMTVAKLINSNSMGKKYGKGSYTPQE